MRYMELWKFEDLLKTNELYFCRADKFKDPLEGSLSKRSVFGTSKTEKAFAETVKLSDQHYERALEYRAAAKATSFVSCWNIDTKESTQMWEEYTESTESIVIITSAHHLHSSLPGTVVGSAVKYVTENQPRVEFGNRSLFFYKDEKYAFEKEYRLLADLHSLGEQSIHRDKPEDFFRRIPVDLEKLIYGINPNPQATPETLKKVEALLQKYLPGGHR